jgi:hypothetical protein
MKSGLFARYQDYLLPSNYGGGVITVRLRNNDEDQEG